MGCTTGVTLKRHCFARYPDVEPDSFMPQQANLPLQKVHVVLRKGTLQTCISDEYTASQITRTIRKGVLSII